MDRHQVQINFLKDEDNEAILDLSCRCPQHGVISGYPDRSPVFNRIHRQLDIESFHMVARLGEKIIGCIGAIFTPVQYGDKTFRSVYLLDFKVDEDYRKGMTAYRLMRETLDFLLRNNVLMGIACIIKGNEASHIFTRGRAGFQGACCLGDIQVNNIMPLWERKIDPRFILANPGQEDIPELVDLYNRFYDTYKLAPRMTDNLFRYYTTEIEGMDLDNMWVAREGGKIKAVLCAWDENIYKRWWVIKIPFSKKLLFMFMRFLSLFVKMPAPIRINEPLRQKTLVMCAHDQCLDGLKALLRHMNNIHLGKGYTVLQTHFHAEDDMLLAQKGLPRLKVEIEAYMATTDPELAGEIASIPGPVHFEWPMFI